jgi:hypothetical protein
MRMRQFILLLVFCPALQYFSTLSHTWKIFEKNNLLKMRGVFVFIFSTILPEIILINIEQDVIKYVYWSTCKSTRYS